MPNKSTAKEEDIKNRAACFNEPHVWKKRRTEHLRYKSKEKSNGFPEIADRYVADYCMNNNRSPKSKINRIKAMTRYFSTMPINALTVQNVDGYISARKKQGVKNDTINYDIAVLKHMFRWAKSRGYVDVDPLVQVVLLKRIERVGERPDESVIDRIFAKLAPVHVPLFTFIRETGCRHGEATSLIWDQVDYVRSSVVFHTTTKSGKAREVPLTPAALIALSSMPKRGKTVFFHPRTLKKYSDNQTERAWRSATKKVMVGAGKAVRPTKLRIHDLRHAYAIKLAEAGCAMHFISEVLGHSSVEFTRRVYARYSPDSASRAVLVALSGGKT